MASSFKQGLSNFISTIINACCVFIISSIVQIAYFALSLNTVHFVLLLYYRYYVVRTIINVRYTQNILYLRI